MGHGGYFLLAHVVAGGGGKGVLSGKKGLLLAE